MPPTSPATGKKRIPRDANPPLPDPKNEAQSPAAFAAPLTKPASGKLVVGSDANDATPTVPSEARSTSPIGAGGDVAAQAQTPSSSANDIPTRMVRAILAPALVPGNNATLEIQTPRNDRNITARSRLASGIRP